MQTHFIFTLNLLFKCKRITARKLESFFFRNIVIGRQIKLLKETETQNISKNKNRVLIVMIKLLQNKRLEKK